MRAPDRRHHVLAGAVRAGAVLAGAAAVALAACRASAPDPAPDRGDRPPAADPTGYTTLHHEDFEDPALLAGLPDWRAERPDRAEPGDAFADRGRYFADRGVTAPPAYRVSWPIPAHTGGGWLVVESYSRTRDRAPGDLVAVVADPAGGGNRVLAVRSPAHTDATVIRSLGPLPPRYRVSLRVGHADFGDGEPGGDNGYDGGERAEPWQRRDATRQNGFYWLAVLDALPRPRNNVWIHHHRKVVVDSDNHYPPWMEIWDGRRFVKSGRHPVMVMAIAGRGEASAEHGKPFWSFSAGAVQPQGAIRAADSYLPRTWYRVTIERDPSRYVIEVSGRFRHGGVTSYRAEFDSASLCVWHYNQPTESPGDCADPRPLPGADTGEPAWRAKPGYPDYLMFGDPHINYYEGVVYYDDVRLEVPAARSR